MKAPEDEPAVVQVGTHRFPTGNQNVESEVELPAAEAQERLLQVFLGDGLLIGVLRLGGVDRALAPEYLDALRGTAEARLQSPVPLGLRAHQARPLLPLGAPAELEGAEPPVAGRRGVERLQLGGETREAALVPRSAEEGAVVHEPPTRPRRQLHILRAMRPEHVPVVAFDGPHKPLLLECRANVVSSVDSACEGGVRYPVGKATPPQGRRRG
mmetsp:Transcript_120619/g.375556  ORF Transcript_120619/g.375556 Transcript_120619/m.375556 type:complete len:213 (+) Transcript_120619:623-1261(+)